MLLTMPLELGAGLKSVSSVPFGFKRARLLRATPFTVVNHPAIKIFPSYCTARLYTSPMMFGVNVASALPFAFSRAREMRGAPPMLVNVPATSVLPSP